MELAARFSSETALLRVVRPFQAVAVALCAVFLLGFSAGSVTAQAAEDLAPPTQRDAAAVRTDSPRETFQSFLRLSDEMDAALVAYLQDPTFEGVSRLALLSDQLNSLLDLQNQPAASRREIGITTMTFLMDIFGRMDPIDPLLIPDTDAMEAEEAVSTRIPDTPLYIMQITEGVRQGEYLFASTSVEVAPRFYRSVRDLPLRSSLPISSLSSLGPQLTGPLIPPSVVAAMPPALRTLWLDTPAWKVIVSIAAAVLLVALAIGVQRVVSALNPSSRFGLLVLRMVLPISLLVVASFLLPAFSFQINVSGRFADALGTFKIALTYGSFAWLFWLSMKLVFEAFILSPRIPDTSLDANLLRLVANVIGIIGVVVILAFGGQAIGLPILSVLAGLGIGGLAVALALRPTLENLVGGVILYVDRPVRVGDFCRFGEQLGTIEAIGVRSTKLRALDRTMVAVPNAQLADMQITNFAYCDRMLLQNKINLRYETTPDQLRYLLVKLREMLHAHPKIERDTVRVRLAEFGASSLDVEIRVYVETREWNEFFAVREDIYLRVYELVIDAGTGFAFPSQTVYLGRDTGVDTGRGEALEELVNDWRRESRLPFPRMTDFDIDRLQGTLDYPPRGSVTGRIETTETSEELLSTEEPPKE